MFPRNAGTRSDRARARARHDRTRDRGAASTLLSLVAGGLTAALVAGVSLAAIATWKLDQNVDEAPLEGETALPAPTIGAFPGGFNVLLVGSDTRDGQGGIGGQSSGALNDVTMLLHVSEDHTSAVAVSIPRDTVVPIPSCPDGKGGRYAAMAAQPFNTSLSYGGLACTALTVEALTGLDIQFAGLIKFRGVIEMSNALGGVDVCVSGPINDSDTGLRIAKAGTVTLKGDRALAFLRTRHGIGDGSDLGRIGSQQVFLSAMVRKLKSADTLGNVATLYGLASAATRNMQLSSNLKRVDTMVAMAQSLRDIPLERIVFVQYPGTTAGTGVYAGKVQPLQERADALFALIKKDQPFTLNSLAESTGSVVDPSAPRPDPSAPPTPTASATATREPVLEDVPGQSAADRTCSKAAG